jgi:uncharacterized lipoprotein YmbA
MGNVRVAAAFSGNSLIYRMDDVNYVSDPNQAFIADPASMLGNEMATWLDRSRAFKSVTQPGSTQSARYVLEATVIELYGDFRPGRQPANIRAAGREVTFHIYPGTRHWFVEPNRPEYAAANRWNGCPLISFVRG